MSLETEIGIIEIGDKNLKCVIFKLNNESPEILSTSIVKSEGIINGTVINSKRASSSIRSCIGAAEEKAKILLKKINVVLEQPDFLSTTFSKQRKINGSKIQKEDIEFLLNEAKKELILNDTNQSVVHIFNHNYIVDGKTFIEEPIEVYANDLSHEITFITIPKNNLKNIQQVFYDCDIEVDRLISNTFALAVQLINNNNLNIGSILINFDYEKTSIGVFKNLAFIHSSTFPVGFNHITKDLSKVCSLSLKDSLGIKKNINFLFKDNHGLFDGDGYLKKNYFNESNYRKISEGLILKIIKTRLDEILSIIKKRMLSSGLNINSGIEIFLTGDGSHLSNIDKYFSIFFGTDIKKLDKNFNDYEQNFNSCFGALKIIQEGWETEALPKKITKKSYKIGFFAKIFGLKE